MSFVEQVINNLVPLEAFDDFVDEWHLRRPYGESLHEFLGMTREQYDMVVKDPDQLAVVIKEIRNGR